jgi:hypothetical protein
VSSGYLAGRLTFFDTQRLARPAIKDYFGGHSSAICHPDESRLPPWSWQELRNLDYKEQKGGRISLPMSEILERGDIFFFYRPKMDVEVARARPDPTEELGINLRPERKPLRSADIFRKLKVEKDVHPLAPLTAGEWA